MTDINKVWPENNETAKARIEQAQKIKSTVADAGIRFEVYLPPDLASWVLEQVEHGGLPQNQWVKIGADKGLCPLAAWPNPTLAGRQEGVGLSIFRF